VIRAARQTRRFISAVRDIPQLRVGITLLGVIVLLAVLAPLLATHDPYALSGKPVSPPSARHWLGTDGLGHDMYSMLLYGIRNSLAIGVVAAAISGVIGTVLGGVAGYFGGLADKLLSELFNIFLMLPTFFLILIIIALFGSSLFNVMMVIGLTTWVSNARLMRAQSLSLRNRTFVMSALAIGETRTQILFRHIIPNGVFPIIANTTMNISGAILTESALSFLGLGDPNVVSLGQIVSNGKHYLTSGWWICTFSGLLIILCVFSFYLIGDGLNRMLSPRLRDVGKVRNWN
jgi:peptide/nickel transport system permease protein